MDNAADLILKAVTAAAKITPAGPTSLLAIAARALTPEARLSRVGISDTLGLHPNLVIAIMVSADLAGDTLSRRELAGRLFPDIPLRSAPPTLTGSGHLACAAFCLEQLRPLAEVLGETFNGVLEVAAQLGAGRKPEPLRVKELLQEAEEMQRTRVVTLDKGARSKMGVPDSEAVRRRASQSFRAFLEGSKPDGDPDAMSLTVAGEVAGALGTGLGMDHSMQFCLDLARHLEQLPDHQADREPGN